MLKAVWDRSIRRIVIVDGTVVLGRITIAQALSFGKQMLEQCKKALSDPELAGGDAGAKPDPINADKGDAKRERRQRLASLLEEVQNPSAHQKAEDRLRQALEPGADEDQELRRRSRERAPRRVLR